LLKSSEYLIQHDPAHCRLDRGILRQINVLAGMFHDHGTNKPDAAQISVLSGGTSRTFFQAKYRFLKPAAIVLCCSVDTFCLWHTKLLLDPPYTLEYWLIVTRKKYIYTSRLYQHNKAMKTVDLNDASFLCPISGALMLEPVVDHEGNA
jgi:hypothetical protein